MTTMLNVMTKGYREYAEDINIIKFTVFVENYWKLKVPNSIIKSDMFVGRPTKDFSIANDPKGITYEDDKRTMVIPIPENLPIIYACINETGGLTFMLASEY